jgi:phytol kinase
LNDVAWILVFVMAFASALGATELLGRRAVLRPDDSRRVAHVSSALVALPMPWLLGWGSIVVLGIVFAAVLTITRRTGGLRSVHGVERATWGEVLFPVGVALLALTGPSHAAWVYGILVMGLSDPVAGLTGQHLGRHPFRVGPSSKTLEGSSAFFVVTVVIGITIAVGADGFDLLAVPLLGVGLAALVLTAAEALLPWGLDNLVLPLLAASLLGSLTATAA